MNKAKIDNGVVVNAVLVDPNNIPDWCADWPELVDGAWIGWLWDGSTFSPPPPEPLPVPQTISMRQCRLQLLADGNLDEVDIAIASMGEAAVIEWQYATEVLRDNALVAAIAELLQMNDAEVDEFFRQAALL